MQDVENHIVHSQKTRRSMISRQQNPAIIHQKSIYDILALQLSETLMNGAYNWSFVSIQLGVQKLLIAEKYFIERKCCGFELIRIEANKKMHQKDTLRNKNQNARNFLWEKQQNLSTQNPFIVLTREQQLEKVYFGILRKFQRVFWILSRKLIKVKFLSLIKIQASQNNKQTNQNIQNSQTQQIYAVSRNSNNLIKNHPNRRSIDNLTPRKQRVSYSLSKGCVRNGSILKKSPLKYLNNNFNKFTYSKSSKKEESTYSQSRNSCIEEQCTSNRHEDHLKIFAENVNKQLITQIKNQQALSANLNNNLSKEKELETQRKKYYRLVEEFKLFSQRFLSVIKEE